jgi:hypothetical protein
MEPERKDAEENWLTWPFFERHQKKLLVLAHCTRVVSHEDIKRVAMSMSVFGLSQPEWRTTPVPPFAGRSSHHRVDVQCRWAIGAVSQSLSPEKLMEAVVKILATVNGTLHSYKIESEDVRVQPWERVVVYRYPQLYLLMNFQVSNFIQYALRQPHQPQWWVR